MVKLSNGIMQELNTLTFAEVLTRTNSILPVQACFVEWHPPHLLEAAMASRLTNTNSMGLMSRTDEELLLRSARKPAPWYKALSLDHINSGWIMSALSTVLYIWVFLAWLQLMPQERIANTKPELGRNNAHCEELLSDGRWSSSNIQGSLSGGFEKWEPFGCRMVRFSREEFRNCLGGRRVVFVGDSTVRQVYWAAATRLDPERAHAAILDLFADNSKHQNIHFEAERVELDFIWDPWLNSSQLTSELERFRIFDGSVSPAVASPAGNTSAALILLGSPGLWATHYGQEDFFLLFQEAVDAIREHLATHLDSSARYPTRDLVKNYQIAPNQLFLAPVQVPYYPWLSPDRIKTITAEKVNKMNAYLSGFSAKEKSHILHVYNEMTRDNPQAFEETGIHVIDKVAEWKADIVLNARCNSALGHRSPHRSTCCMRYPHPGWFQHVVLMFGILAYPLLALVKDWNKTSRRYTPILIRVLEVARSILIPLSWCWMIDRSHAYPKVERNYDQIVFVGSSVCFLIAGFLTCHKFSYGVNWSVMTLRRVSSHEVQTCDQILSREQSEECKGWMQAIILMYHWTYASQTLWVYKIVRTLVSTYIYLFAYGHTLKALKTGEVSFRRLASVIFRLNFLSILLSYMMETTYTFYYFIFVVTFWYVVIWITLRAFSAFNNVPVLFFTKVLIASITTTLIISMPGFLGSISSFCGTFFQWSFDETETRFRLFLEGYIAYFGMITASVVQRMASHAGPDTLSNVQSTTRFYKQHSLADPACKGIMLRESSHARLRDGACILCMLCLLAYWTIIQTFLGSKEQYSAIHPYISWIPVLCFAFLRNSCRELRARHLALPAALGKISLETYVLQHHVWLASDATALLRSRLWDQIGLWRVLEIVIITCVFFHLSAMAHHGTETLANWLFGQPSMIETSSKLADSTNQPILCLRGLLRHVSMVVSSQTGRSTWGTGITPHISKIFFKIALLLATFWICTVVQQ
ncbi:10 TM acyl transferase domain found in Cas1p-domain-containing protein [Xylariales sp. PMI_506]|nr:10 TM acyl transferase domain found in Cas1p-domain-containing protein [Xylariales sp. PMI_506]